MGSALSALTGISVASVTAPGSGSAWDSLSSGPRPVLKAPQLYPVNFLWAWVILESVSYLYSHSVFAMAATHWNALLCPCELLPLPSTCSLGLDLCSHLNTSSTVYSVWYCQALCTEGWQWSGWNVNYFLAPMHGSLPMILLLPVTSWVLHNFSGVLFIGLSIACQDPGFLHLPQSLQAVLNAGTLHLLFPFPAILFLSD